MHLDPSFYCESCGRKVSDRMDRCPGCGQEFDSVLCTSCGFKGASFLFKENCPQCGYTGFDKYSSVMRDDKKKQFPPWLYKLVIVILAATLIGLIRAYSLL